MLHSELQRVNSNRNVYAFRESKNGTIIYLSSTYIVHVIRIRSQTGCAVRFVDTFMKSVRRMEAIFLPLEWRSLAFPSYVQLHLTHLMSYWLPPLLVTETWPEFVFILLIFKWVVFVSFSDFIILLFFLFVRLPCPPYLVCIGCFTPTHFSELNPVV